MYVGIPWRILEGRMGEPKAWKGGKVRSRERCSDNVSFGACVDLRQEKAYLITSFLALRSSLGHMV